MKPIQIMNGGSSDCSSPLSSRSDTLSPPPFHFEQSYPSPPSSQEASDNDSSCTGHGTKRMMSDQEGPPPAKKRRVAEKKPKSTEYLDLTKLTLSVEQSVQLDRLVKALHGKRKVVVIAGAGISVSAGVPDFRSSSGLFTTLRAEHNLKGSGKDLFDASVYKDADSTSYFHDMVRNLSKLTKNAEATAFHHLVASLAQDGRLLRLYTQNVDGIDTSLQPLITTVPLQKTSEGKWPKAVQLHGGLDKMVCTKCGHLSEFDASLFEGPVPPICPECQEQDRIRTQHANKRSHGVGFLRPRMVLYNEHNPDDVAIGNVVAEDLRKRPDAVIVVGTSLKIPGVKRIVREMCGIVRDRRDGMSVWINNDPEPGGAEFKDCWDIVVRGPCDQVAKHAKLPRWYEMDVSTDVTEEDWEEAKVKDTHVVINTTFKPIPSTDPFRTAPASPDFSPFACRKYDAEVETLHAPPTPSKSPSRSLMKKTPLPTAFDVLKLKKAVTDGKTKTNAGRKPKATTGKSKPRAKASKISTVPNIRIDHKMTQSKSSMTKVVVSKGNVMDPVHVADIRNNSVIID